jgi:hypothetical protein
LSELRDADVDVARGQCTCSTEEWGSLENLTYQASEAYARIVHS